MSPSVLRSFIIFAIMAVVAVGIVAVIAYTMEETHQEQVPDY
jgi:uncharacterized membrane protein YjgN (DUF898 family)